MIRKIREVSFFLFGIILFVGCATHKENVEAANPLVFPQDPLTHGRSSKDFPSEQPSELNKLSEIKRSGRKEITLVVGGSGVSSFILVGVLNRLQLEGVRVSHIVSTGLPSVLAGAYSLLKSRHDLEWFCSKWEEGHSTSQKRLRDFLNKNLPSRDIDEGKTALTLAFSDARRERKGQALELLPEAAFSSQDYFLDYAESEKYTKHTLVVLNLYERNCSSKDKSSFCRQVHAVEKQVKTNRALYFDWSLPSQPRSGDFHLNVRKAILLGFEKGKRIVSDLNEKLEP